jgi:hypothetical protein
MRDFHLSHRFAISDILCLDSHHFLDKSADCWIFVPTCSSNFSLADKF